MKTTWESTTFISVVIQIIRSALHLLGGGDLHGGDRGGLSGIRGVAEGLSILETGREGAETGVPAAVAIVGWGGGGNLAAALEAAEQVATTAMVL